MKNKLIIALIISLVLAHINFASIVVNNGSYQRKQNEEYLLKSDAYDYFKSLQKWIDQDSKVELLRKVASHSELKGFKSENPIDWEHLYDDMGTKATRSDVN